MSYIDDCLGQNEAILYRAQFPWFYHAGAWGLLIALVVGGGLAYAYGYGWIGGLLVATGLVLFVAIMAPIWTTEIGVTNQRLIYKRGLLWRKTQELQLRAIEEVNLEQGLLGRIFDFGQLVLHGTGVDDIRLPSLADPIGIRKALQDGMAASTQPGLVVVPAPPASSQEMHSAA
jgi:uncharacterized membrane protein YdbT with pleckstrin-like domain